MAYMTDIQAIANLCGDMNINAVLLFLVIINGIGKFCPNGFCAGEESQRDWMTRDYLTYLRVYVPEGMAHRFQEF